MEMKPPARPPEETPQERFDNVMRKVLSVSPEELKRLKQAQKDTKEKPKQA